MVRKLFKNLSVATLLREKIYLIERFKEKKSLLGKPFKKE